MSETRPVCIVGGGILGLTLAYRLACGGRDVRVFEREHTLGGLAAAFDFDGHLVDRYYHVVLPTDHHVTGLARELGLGDRLQFRTTRVGYFDAGRMYSLSSILEFLRFKPLSLGERLRLALFVLRCQRMRDWRPLDTVPLDEWLERLCGPSLTRKMWLPLLRSKFDDQPAGLPATYLWARTRRMSSNRDAAAARESMGCVLGGYQILADALASAIRARGGQVHTGVAVRALEVANGAVVGLHSDLGYQPASQVISTLLPCHGRHLLPAGTRLSYEPERYLGIVCLMLKLRQSLSPYYLVNITDRSVPFTTVVETTRVIGPENLGGYSLVYVPRYVQSDSPYFDRSDTEIEQEFLHHLRRLFPHLREEDIAARRVVRARAVEPVHGLGAGERVAPIQSPLPGLIQTSTAQIYPALVNCEAVIQLAETVLAQLESGSADLPGAVHVGAK
jgi:protoporphyrinogen oxidase